jgi:flagellar biosynthesis/type III secretory pathway chaperone
MRPAAAALAAALDEAAALHERLVELAGGQRRALAAGQAEAVEALAREMETAALRLGAVEDGRRRAAEDLADQLGLAATRWSTLREALPSEERRGLEPRVERLEALVRELELANAINGRLIRRELDLVDFSIRGLLGAAQGPPVARYTPAGQMDSAPAAGPVLLDTTA